jgi:hypothetical protein
MLAVIHLGGRRLLAMLRVRVGAAGRGAVLHPGMRIARHCARGRAMPHRRVVRGCRWGMAGVWIRSGFVRGVIHLRRSAGGRGGLVTAMFVAAADRGAFRLCLAIRGSALRCRGLPVAAGEENDGGKKRARNGA